ncbi:MAG TPA: TonB-dependent receptor [archaeon]|nr:TonB-dependent receptor [archaeon]
MQKFGKLSIFGLGLALLIFSTAALAQTTGKIEGTVRDQDTGSPMAGVQVNIEGTRLGNVTNEDGYYFILNVPVGLMTVKFSFTGYKPVSVVDARVSAGNTITVNTTMSSAVIGLEAITVVGEAEPLMVRDNVQTRQNIEAEMISNIPANSLEDLVALQAGVVVDNSGNYSIRGGREGEEAMYVDGIPVKAQNEQQATEDRGAVETNAGGQINPLVLAQDAIEEVSLITGGFQAEFGNAQAGMINIVTKEGGTKISGRLEFISDEMMPESYNYGYNKLEGNINGPLVSNKLTFSVTGMLKGMDDAFPRMHGDKGGFRGITQKFVDGLNKDLGSIGVVKDGVADRSDAMDPFTVNSFAHYSTTTESPELGYGILNEDGSISRGFQRADGYAFRLLTQDKVIADPADVTADGQLRTGAQPIIQIDPTTGSLFAIGSDGTASGSPAAIDEAFARGVAVDNPIYPGPYMNPKEQLLPGNWNDVYAYSLKSIYMPTQQLKILGAYHKSRNQRQFYDHSYLFNNPSRTNQARKWHTDLALGGADFQLFSSSKRSLNAQARVSYFRNNLDGGLLLREDALDRGTFMGIGGDIHFLEEGETNRYMLYSAQSSDGFANDLIEPTALMPDLDRTQNIPTDQVTASNIFGATTPSRKGERGSRMYARQFVNNGMALALTNDFERRLGVKLDFDSQLDRYNRLRFGFEDYRWNVLETARFYYGEFTDDEYNAKPRLFGFYAQDRIDLGDFVIDLGLRLDRFDKNKQFPIIIGQNNPDFSDAKAVPEVENNWSPRISVAHPVTERTQVRLSYGHFYQIPPFEVLYSMSERDFMVDALSNPNQLFGNGWLGMGQTIQFEAGFTSLLSDNLVIDFVGYNREIRGNFGYRLATSDDLRVMANVAPDYVIRGQGNLRVVTNQDNGNVKGFDLTIDKRYSRYIGLRGTYSLMFARSTESDPWEYTRTLARQLDPFTQQSPPPPAVFTPTDNDRTHQVSVMLRLQFPRDFQQGTGLGRILGDFGANFNIRYATGVPYTPVDKQGNFVTKANSARTPDFKLADLRLSKGFMLGGNHVRVTATIFNLFENVNYGQQGIDPTSGQVGNDKYFIQEILPSALETSVRTEAQLIRDFNKDGFVSKSEAAAAAFAKGLAQDYDPRFWLRPREIRLGLEYAF